MQKKLDEVVACMAKRIKEEEQQQLEHFLKHGSPFLNKVLVKPKIKFNRPRPPFTQQEEEK